MNFRQFIRAISFFWAGVCLLIGLVFAWGRLADASYIPTVGSNIGIGTSTPVGALTVMSGNVGVGTWSPVSKLQVIGTVNATAFVGDGSGLTNVTGANSGWTDGGTNVYTSTTTDNVGIGTTTPASTLTIAGNIGIGTTPPYRTIAGPVNGMIVQGNVGIGTWSASDKLIVMGGNVGIGTNAPGYPLYVSKNGTGISGVFQSTCDGCFSNVVVLNAANPAASTVTAAMIDFAIGVENAPFGQIGAAAENSSSGGLVFRTSLVGNVTEKMRIDRNGNVGIATTQPIGGLVVMNGNTGIGTWSPVTKLQVVDASSSSEIAVFTNQGGFSEITVGNSAGYTLMGHDANRGYLKTETGRPLAFETDANEHMRILTTGNIGIGTTNPVGGLVVMNGNAGIGTWSPVQKLEVVGTVKATAFVGDGSGLTGISANSGWTDGGTNVYTTTTTDNVGIGTTSPVQQLEVVGNDNGPGTIAPVAIKATASGSNTGTGIILDSTALSGGRAYELTSSGPGAAVNSAFAVWDVTGAAYRLTIMGDGNIGLGTYSPTAGLAVMNGNVGIGTWNAVNRLSVVGNIGIGTTLPYRRIPAPNNGMLVEGNVGIGTWTANGKLVVMGLVGIGTTSPSDPLDVSASLSGRAIVSVTNTSSSGYSEIEMHDNTGADQAVIGYGNSSTGTYQAGVGFAGTEAATDFLLISNNVDRIHLTSGGGIGIGTSLPTVSSGLAVMSGNVGIGTWSSPANRLSILGNIGIGTTLPYRRISAPNNGMVVEGNVGIGTWSPSQQLQVVGTVSATAFVGDGSGLTGISANSGWTDGGANVFTSTTTDNVGIGTTTPTAQLLIENAGSQDSLRVNDAVLDGSPFIVDASGNVGIGTTTAAYPLDIRVSAAGLDLVRFQNTSSSGYSDNVFIDDGGTMRGSFGYANTSAPDVNLRGKNFFWIGTSDFMVTNSAVENLLTVTNTGRVGIGTSLQVAGLSVMNGNVGIGTWSPTQRLQVVGTVSATAFVGDGSGLTGISAGGWTDGGTNVYTSTTTDNVGIGTTTPATTFEIVKTSNRKPLMVSGSAAGQGNFLVIDSIGNVGIGTTTPSMNLHIYEAFNPGLLLDNGGLSSIMLTNGSGGNEINANGGGTTSDLLFKVGDASSGNPERLRITNLGDVGIGTSTPVGGTSILNGNVGIGTWSPTARLQVVGNINVADPATVNSVSVGNGNTVVTNSTVALGISNTVTGNTNAMAVGISNTSYGIVLGRGSSALNSSSVAVGDSVINTIANSLQIGPSDSAKMMIDSSGNIGLGTIEPKGKLIVLGGNVGLGTTAPVGGLSIMNGNVGIGTWSPTARLQVVGTVSATTFIGDGSGLTGISANSGWTDGGTNVYTSTTTDNVGIGTTTPTAALLVENAGTQATLRINDMVLDDSPFMISSAGNVGIGTTNPNAKFDLYSGDVTMLIGGDNSAETRTNATVKSARILFPQYATADGNATLLFANSQNGGNVIYLGGGTSYASAVSQIEFYTATGTTTLTGTRRMVVTSNGNVGIGTIDDPLGRLTVMGGNVGIGTINPQGAFTVLNGNAGIGTWSPTQRLQVVGTVAATAFTGDGSGLTGISAGGWSDGGTNVYTSTTTDNVGIGTTTPNAATLEIVKNAGQAPLKISSNATGSGNLLVVDSIGNVGVGTINTAFAGFSIKTGPVGIGTSKPAEGVAGFTGLSVVAAGGASEALSGSGSFVADTSAYFVTNSSLTRNNNLVVSSGRDAVSSIYFGNAGDGFQMAGIEYNNSDLNGLAFVTNSVTDRLYIDVAGNVGIGTSKVLGGFSVMNGKVGIGTWNPVNSLSVVGNIGIGTTLPYRRIAGPNNGMLVEGNVGIGTWAPHAQLTLVQPTTYVSPQMIVRNGTSTNITSYPSSFTPTFTIQTNETTGSRPLFFGYDNAGSWDSFLTIGACGAFSSMCLDLGQANNVYTALKNVGANLYIGGGISGQADGSFTDIYFYNSGNIGIGTNTPAGGLTVMNGNVGIGTWSPTARLQVVGTVSATSFVGDGSALTGISAGGWTDGGTNVYTSTTTDNVAIGTTTPIHTLTVAGNIGIGTTAPYRTIAGPRNGFVAEGNVGIGTWRPDAQLEIAKLGAQTPLMVSSTGNGNGDYLIVLSDGRVGIGTTSPGEKVEAVNSFDGQAFFAFANYTAGASAASGVQVKSNSASGYLTATSSSYALQHLADRVGFGSGVDASGLDVYSPNQDIHFLIGDVTLASNIRMAVDSAGNVGIGTSTSSNLLGVIGSVGIGTTTPYRRITGPANGLIAEGNVGIGTWSASNGKLVVLGGNVGVGTVTPVGALTVLNGNVGIGTWSPVNTLQVKGSLTSAAVTLTDAATIATDASLGNLFRVTLGGNRTLGNPTNGVDGQKITWELIQDGSGSRTITLDTKFALGTDISSVTLSTTAAKRDFLGAIYNASTDKWYVVSFVKGY